MSWLFKNKKKRDPTISDSLSLTSEQVVRAATEHQQTTLDNISNDLQSRLKKELSGILGEVVDTAIDNSRAEIEQLIRNELITMLESRLDQLVEQSIKKHLTKPRHDRNN